MSWESIGLGYLMFVYVGVLLTAWPQILGGVLARPFSILIFLICAPVIYPFVLLAGMTSGFPKSVTLLGPTSINRNDVVRRLGWSCAVLVVVLLLGVVLGLFNKRTVGAMPLDVQAQPKHGSRSEQQKEISVKNTIKSEAGELASIKPSGIDEQMTLSEGAQPHIKALIAAQAGDRSALDRTQQYDDMSLIDAATEQSAQEMAARTLPVAPERLPQQEAASLYKRGAK